MAAAATRVITVAKDGSGYNKTVQEAIDAVPLGNTLRTVIRVSPGTHKQPLYVPKTKNFITLARPELTVLSWNNTASKINHHQTSEVIGMGTFASGTVIVEGEDFIAENITFENSSPQGSEQAVARRVTAKHCAFYNCRFLGRQMFDQWKREVLGYTYMYLGRPWRSFGRAVLAYIYMDQYIRNVGWNNWGNPENERNACFYEYRCFGPGCCQLKRVTRFREFLDEEAKRSSSLILSSTL